MPHRLTVKNVGSGISHTNNYGHKRRTPITHADFKHDKTPHMARLNRRAVEEGVYEAESGNMSGYRTQKNYNGNAPVRWNPKEDFVEETSGFTEQAGGFMGGKNKVKAGKKKDYARASGKTDSDNPNPHPIVFKKKSVRFK